MRELPEPDTHCFDDDTGKDVWSHSRDQVLAIQKQAYEDGLRDACQSEMFDRIDTDLEALLKEAESHLPVMLTASQKERQ